MSDFDNAARAVALVDAAAIAHNFSLLQDLAARTTGRHVRMLAVVKANAYGHGLSLAVPALCRAGCSFFAVATFDEAMQVRRLAPRALILILGYTPPKHAQLLARHALLQAVFSREYAAVLSASAMAAGVTVGVHLKLDVGMSRLGFDPEDTSGLLAVASYPTLLVKGLFCHFPMADCDSAATTDSLTRFLNCQRVLDAAGLRLFCHAAASAALLTLPCTLLDGCRPGLALYGLSPVSTSLALRPALSLHAPIVQLRRVAAGTPVGYGGEFIASRPSLIGTLPIGYADGLCRAAAGATVTLSHHGTRFLVPLVGRICMDYAMADLTDTPAATGDSICLFDRADTLAAHVGTIPYEILTAIGPRVARIGKGML